MPTTGQTEKMAANVEEDAAKALYVPAIASQKRIGRPFCTIHAPNLRSFSYRTAV